MEVSSAHAEYHHPYLEVREIKRAGFIIVTTDRGMCGGLNTNLLKTAVSALKDLPSKSLEEKKIIFYRHMMRWIVSGEYKKYEEDIFKGKEALS